MYNMTEYYETNLIVSQILGKLLSEVLKFYNWRKKQKLL